MNPEAVFESIWAIPVDDAESAYTVPRDAPPKAATQVNRMFDCMVKGVPFGCFAWARVLYF